MTGAFVRVQNNDGKWTSIEIEQCTDEQFDGLEKATPEKGWVWAKFLANWIRDNVIVASQVG